MGRAKIGFKRAEEIEEQDVMMTEGIAHLQTEEVNIITELEERIGMCNDGIQASENRIDELKKEREFLIDVKNTILTSKNKRK